MTYQEAYNELQEILAQLRSEEVSIDEMKTKVTRARELIEFCQKKLRDIAADLTEDE